MTWITWYFQPKISKFRPGPCVYINFLRMHQMSIGWRISLLQNDVKSGIRRFDSDLKSITLQCPRRFNCCMQHPAFESHQLHTTRRHHKHHLRQNPRDKASNLEKMANASPKQIKRPEVLTASVCCGASKRNMKHQQHQEPRQSRLACNTDILPSKADSIFIDSFKALILRHTQVAFGKSIRVIRRFPTRFTKSPMTFQN